MFGSKNTVIQLQYGHQLCVVFTGDVDEMVVEVPPLLVRDLRRVKNFAYQGPRKKPPYWWLVSPPIRWQAVQRHVRSNIAMSDE